MGEFKNFTTDIFRELDSMINSQSKGYPKYNLLRSGDAFYIQIAVAGFDQTELSAKLVDRTLIVTGSKMTKDDAEYVVHGIASRDFEQRFTLSNDSKIVGVTLLNGILTFKIEQVMDKPREVELEIKTF